MDVELAIELELEQASLLIGKVIDVSEGVPDNSRQYKIKSVSKSIGSDKIKDVLVSLYPGGRNVYTVSIANVSKKNEEMYKETITDHLTKDEKEKIKNISYRFRSGAAVMFVVSQDENLVFTKENKRRIFSISYRSYLKELGYILAAYDIFDIESGEIFKSVKESSLSTIHNGINRNFCLKAYEKGKELVIELEKGYILDLSNGVKSPNIPGKYNSVDKDCLMGLKRVTEEKIREGSIVTIFENDENYRKIVVNSLGEIPLLLVNKIEGDNFFLKSINQSHALSEETIVSKRENVRDIEVIIKRKLIEVFSMSISKEEMEAFENVSINNKPEPMLRTYAGYFPLRKGPVLKGKSVRDFPYRKDVFEFEYEDSKEGIQKIKSKEEGCYVLSMDNPLFEELGMGEDKLERVFVISRNQSGITSGTLFRSLYDGEMIACPPQEMVSFDINSKRKTLEEIKLEKQASDLSSLEKESLNQMTLVLSKIYDNKSLRSKVVPLFLGNPGLGKTKIIEAFAKEKGAKLIELITSQMSPMEISGIAMPDKDTKTMTYFNFDKLKELKDGDIIFFDEVLNGNPVILNACLTILEQRRLISGDPLPEVMIIAASNPQGMVPMTPQVKERFLWYDINFSPVMCKNFFKKKYNLPEIMLDKIVNLIKEEKFDGRNFNTPRSIDKAIEMVQAGCPTPYESDIREVLNVFVTNTSYFKKKFRGYELMPGEKISWLELNEKSKDDTIKI